MSAPVASPASTTASRLGVLLLAAGRSTRMGGPNKLLQVWKDRPLVRHAAEAALATGGSVLVVTGHQADAVMAALAGLKVDEVHNLDYREGLSTSLRAGFRALPPGAEQVAVMLGDMPLVEPAMVLRLADALASRPQAAAAIPVVEGTWGNPVVLARRLETRIEALSGDAGARKVLESMRDEVVECPVHGDAATTDIDTPDALGALRAR